MYHVDWIVCNKKIVIWALHSNILRVKRRNQGKCQEILKTEQAKPTWKTQ